MAIADCDFEDLFDIDDEEKEDLEKMESDVKLMALKVIDYRKNLADNLKNTLDSAISSHRPNIDSGSYALPLDYTVMVPPFLRLGSEEVVVPRYGAHLGTEEQESPDRYAQLKETVCRNVATMPLVVKRMRECKESINKSNSLKGTIHPAFTRPKAN